MKVRHVLVVCLMVTACVSAPGQDAAVPVAPGLAPSAPAETTPMPDTATPGDSTETKKQERVERLMKDADQYMEAKRFSIVVDILNNVLLIDPENERAREGLYRATVAASKQEQDEKEKEAAPQRPQLSEPLEKLLGHALENCALIRVAEADVQRSQAALAETRLRVAREITTKYEERLLIQGEIEHIESLMRISQVGQEARAQRTGSVAVPSPGAEDAQARALGLPEKKQQLRRVEAELEYLLGEVPKEGELLKVRIPSSVASSLEAETTKDAPEALVREPMPENFEKLFAQTVDFEVPEMKYPELAQLLSERWGVTVLSHPTLRDQTGPALSLKQVTWRQVLELISDLTQTAFIFRDYGVLIVRSEWGRGIAGAAIPINLPLR